ncbi:MAG: VWA containing CoxE family protein [Spirulina sp.]
MNPGDFYSIVTQLFHRLRRDFNLGMREYFVALEAVEGGWGNTREELQETLQLLWCKSPSDRAQLEMIWEELAIAETTPESQDSQSDRELVSPSSTSEMRSPDPPQTIQPILPQPQTAPELAPLAFQPPAFRPVEYTEESNFETYWPVSRRSMAYLWRYLRRFVPQGIPDVLDVATTVEKASKQGYFLAPVYRQSRQNLAQLLLLVDRNGSMVPFHYLARDLVETAQYESTLDRDRVTAVYFHNVPAEKVYRDIFLTRPVAFAEVLGQCDRSTSVLIISDAGAARGYRRLSRIRATTRVLRQIRRYTEAVAWLNPMPSDRWEGTSAQVLMHLVQMFALDEEGLSQAIDFVRGF